MAAQLAFNSGRIVEVIDPGLALAVGLLGTLAVVYLGEAFERQYARATFARFVPPASSTRCSPAPTTTCASRAVERVCTVMFSDLRGLHSSSPRRNRWSR